MTANPVFKTIDFLADKHVNSLSITRISGFILEQINRHYYLSGQKYGS